jgi:glutamate 5-kinase
MRTKVESARVATASAAHAVIGLGRRPDVVVDAVAGRQVGTWFVAKERRVEARRLWIGFALNVHGRLHVDAGAVVALTRRGTSLLGVGVTRAEGEFSAGDAVEIVAPDGTVVARGLTNYDTAEIARVAGV